ncbi:2-amino-4-hydroxy-6- hydroxymethyldihydropteridine pyrophosphokinase [Prochlorococcus sp. MIT 0601]|nr:2-amino-4-hydroxy-6- hydroxymethyldihydropteridine pyrophosphokinase [Prochlorococcus sp. MIT 0601]
MQVVQETDQDISSIYSSLNWTWSPLYKTKPIGGPSNQPDYVNAVVIIKGGFLNKKNPSENAALELLKRLLKLETEFGRNRASSKIRWGPRSLDIDIISWGELHLNTSNLKLPHPRLTERAFVVIPLAKAMQKYSNDITQITGQKGWPE